MALQFRLNHLSCYAPVSTGQIGEVPQPTNYPYTEGALVCIYLVEDDSDDETSDTLDIDFQHRDLVPADDD